MSGLLLVYYHIVWDLLFIEPVISTPMREWLPFTKRSCGLLRLLIEPKNKNTMVPSGIGNLSHLISQVRKDIKESELLSLHHIETIEENIILFLNWGR